jgi:hypothetical protein
MNEHGNSDLFEDQSERRVDGHATEAAATFAGPSLKKAGAGEPQKADPPAPSHGMKSGGHPEAAKQLELGKYHQNQRVVSYIDSKANS